MSSARPSSTRRQSELYAGKPLPHFNEVDECAGVDAIITNRVWSAMHLDPATTLHDVRWGEQYTGDGIDDFVWVFQISGAVPASHLAGGYANARERAPAPDVFPVGRRHTEGRLQAGARGLEPCVHRKVRRCTWTSGRATAVELPAEETERRWEATTSQWPIMHVLLEGVTRDQFMARHHANHVNVAYAPTAEIADRALEAKAAMFAELGVQVHLCGV